MITATTTRRAVMLGLTALIGLQARRSQAKEAPKEWDGLEQRPSKNVALLYVRPGASLAGYKRVRVERLQVAFDKNWDPNSGRRGVDQFTAGDFEKMKNTLADEFAKVVKEELAKGGYDVVTEPGEDVLDVAPFVIDLYVVAPQKMTAGRSTTYTTDTGRMTLVAEMRDSDTGQILARVVDKRWAPSTGTWQMSSSVTNLGAARQVIQRWAVALRNALDVANGKPVP
jgi:hypothetical protein